MSNYRRYNARRPSVGRWMDLKYPGRCAVCARELEKGARAFDDPADRTVCCTDLASAKTYGVTRAEWCGAPTSGRWCDVLSEIRMGRMETVRDPGEDAADRWNEANR